MSKDCFFIDSEALNILCYEYHQKKLQEQEQRWIIMMQKVADLRQLKHTQITNFQRLLEEEQQMNEHLKKQKSQKKNLVLSDIFYCLFASTHLVG